MVTSASLILKERAAVGVVTEHVNRLAAHARVAGTEVAEREAEQTACGKLELWAREVVPLVRRGDACPVAAPIGCRLLPPDRVALAGDNVGASGLSKGEFLAYQSLDALSAPARVQLGQ